MVDRPIKVDESTDRLVTDLAYFLRASKKSVVRDAVAEFAETHHPRHLAGSGGVDRGGSAKEGTHRGAGGVTEPRGPAGVVESAEQGGPTEVVESAEQRGPAGVGESAQQRGPTGVGTFAEDGETAEVGEFGLMVGGGLVAGDGIVGGGGVDGIGGIAGGDGIKGARDRGVTFEMLDPFDRLALRRRELLRQFAELGGTNVRVLDPDDEDAASGEPASGIVLLAETDPVDGSAAVPALEEVARRVLGVHATVVSLTALRLFGSSGREERAVAQSRPL